MTDYIILRQFNDDGPDEWVDLNLVEEASSPKRALAAAGITTPGRYVAVPARSWKPLTVKVEETVKVTIT